MNHIRIYHSVWDMELSPNAFRTYCALLRFTNTSTDYANVCKRKLASVIGSSEASVTRGIRELLDTKLVQVVRKTFAGHRLANGYRMTKQTGKYTMLPYTALALPVTACGFVVYAYIQKCANTARRAFPSLRNIAEAVRCTVKTVIEQIRALSSCLRLRKKNHVKKNGAFGHNQYTILDCIAMVISDNKKEGTHRHSASLPALPSLSDSRDKEPHNTINIRKIFAFVKHFLIRFILWVVQIVRGQDISDKGYCNFDSTSTRPISLYKRKKKKKLYCRYSSRLRRFAKKRSKGELRPCVEGNRLLDVNIMSLGDRRLRG